MKKRKGKVKTVLLVLVFVIGLSLLLYPLLSDYWNSFHQSKAILTYTQSVENLDKEKYDEILKAAHSFNSLLPEYAKDFKLTPEETEQYNSLLNLSGDGVMGYVEIPVIGCTMPIYHGTDDTVLQVAAGHMPWSSLPVGGEGTHCVISGHRGLPSAKLFSELDRLIEGDKFMLRVLDEVLTYEVDQILIVEPRETDALLLTPGKDYCTLVTCTPYGVNSHRLLVRGHRVPNEEEAKKVTITADANQLNSLLVALCIAVPAIIIVFIIMMLPRKHSDDSFDIYF